jgi:hypothetical protein
MLVVTATEEDMIQAELGQKQGPISKITKAKRAGGVAQAAEQLPSKCKALSSCHLFILYWGLNSGLHAAR